MRILLAFLLTRCPAAVSGLGMLGFLIGTAASAAEAEADFGPYLSPSFDNPKLSPDGKHVAVRRVAQDRPFLEIYNVATSESLGTFIMEEGIGIGDHLWGDNRRLLIQVRRGDEFWTDGLARGNWLRYDIQTGKNHRLFQNTPRRALSARGLLGKTRFYAFSDHLVGHAFDDDPNDVLVIFPDTRDSWVSRYDTRRDRYERLADVPSEIFDVHADREGRVLATWGQPPSASRTFKDQVQLLYRRTGDDEFKTALAGHIDELDVDLVAAGPRKDSVYILENATGPYLGLSVLDLTDGAIKAVFRPGRTDVIRTYLDGKRTLYAVRYDDHFPQFHYPDPNHPAAVLHRFAMTGFKNMDVEIPSLARDAPQAILDVRGDSEPGMYYLAELGGKEVKGLFRRAPGVADLGTRHPIEFPAADGTRLTGYITLPSGHTEGEPIPFVVLPGDDMFSLPATWGYDAESQLFASRGFVVLEVNVRGSLGFGREFRAAGLGHVATRGPADLGAGVNTVVANGTADPDRICIVGRRFGAYAALLASMRRPAQYRCVVTINGTYDVAAIRKFLPAGGARERFAGQIARADADDAAFREISPRYLAARIDTPLLIVDAVQLTRTMPTQAREMIRPLKNADIPHEVHEVSTTRTNRLLTHASRREAYARIVTFLEEHLGPAL